MKLGRLRSMSGAELSYRLHERWRIQVDRLQYWLSRANDRDAEFTALLETYSESFKNYLQCGPALRFYPSITPENRDGTVELMLREMQPFVDRALAEAERLKSHCVDLLAFENLSLGYDIDWHRDPVTGHRWRKRFWADYDLVREQYPDPKIVHELNRHQHLPRLGKAFLLTNDERFAAAAVFQMESWIEQNRKWEGINWQSSLEIALRVLSWLWTIFLILPSKACDERAVRRVCASLFAQVDRIYRYPSVYSSPNTQLLGEAAVLFIAGIVFAELHRAEEWRRKGESLLFAEMERQVLNDGVHCKLSPYLHCYATDFFIQALVLAKSNRLPIPERVWSRLSSMLEVVMHWTRPDGTLPHLGDDDGGRAVALAAKHYHSYSDGLCTGAVLFGREDFKFVGGYFTEETLWLLGKDSWPIFHSMGSHPPSTSSRFFLNAGCAVQRSDWQSEASYLTFDFGDYGTDSGDHPHADALSLTLFVAGKDMLVDPATSVYNCAPDWLNFFRSTRAHNTVVVDGQDQSPTPASSRSRKVATRFHKCFAAAGLEYIDAEHDGYARLPQPIVHRRRLLYVRPGYWVVLDELTGHGEHTFDFMYHFAPGSDLFVVGDEENGEVACRARSRGSSLQIAMTATAPVTAEALCGQVSPIQGWTSELYGQRKAAPVIKATIVAPAPVAAISFLVPNDASVRTSRCDLISGRGIAASICNGQCEDYCILSMAPTVEMRLKDFSMQGEFFWLRLVNGKLRQLLAVNARRFERTDEVIFAEKSSITRVVAHFWDNGTVIERGEEEGSVYLRDLRDRQLQRG